MKKEKSEFKKYNGSENDFQIAVANLIRHYTDKFHHSPNEGLMKPQYGAKRKRMGVSAGFPDFIIIHHKFISDIPVPGIVIELKVGYNKPTPEQQAWLNYFNEQGWIAFWTNSMDKVIEILKEYFKK